MRYPAKFEVTPEGGFVVTIRDIPEVFTQGDTKAEAMEMAVDALVTTMGFYFKNRRPIPAPSKTRSGERMVELPASITAKVLLLNAVIESGITFAELARRLEARPQEISNIININHTTKIDTIDKALHALGKRLEIQVNT